MSEKPATMDHADLAGHDGAAPARWPSLPRPAARTLGAALRLATPALSILALWHLAILFSGLPAFVIPRPERVLETLIHDRSFITVHLLATLEVRPSASSPPTPRGSAWPCCSTACRSPATC